ncbi:indole-3-glycerol phosphate synthase [Desulfobaculum xiamenense]|uniref:indole-3-glycerol-phosphate synthase n=1 Tax=Desulfobaculum xiamenense TaxID=995050 RepID=A0A846QHF5_9BACT|nr:indole-3-glycerol-phosphate synthase [Desulfobaculum xiamenense]NJB68266.1 indole-3-glycerol phosphate synthase [Desulfobaculum xiamenense]
MLDAFAKAKQAEIAALEALAAAGDFPAPWAGERPSFVESLLRRGPGAIIAEYKRASPSRGDIAPELRAADVAMAYARGGAAAVSVLTQEEHFRGRLEFLDEAAGCGLPLLRKDFILHPLQVRRTAATPASAVLLIARMVPVERLALLVPLCRELGLTAVTEIFDEADLHRARQAGARVIQVNNRDLDTLAVNLDVSRAMVARRIPGEIWISASGITRHAEVAEMAAKGYDAVLVGTSLMEGGDPAGALERLRSGEGET